MERRKKACYVVAHLDVTAMPPRLLAFGTYSFPAALLTTHNKEMLLDWFHIEAESFGDALERVLDVLRRNDFYLGRGWLRTFTQPLLDAEARRRASTDEECAAHEK